MTVNRITRIVLIMFITVTAAGCGGSAPSRFYTLEPTSAAEGAPAASYSVTVGPVSIPAAVDRPQFVVQVAPNRVEVDEFNRWAGPLDESIARVVAGNLSVLLSTPHVAKSPLANFDPAYRVAIDVQQFESVVGKSALVEAVWTVRAEVGGETRSGRTIANEPVEGKSFDALAAAHSRALAQMSRDIAAAILVAEEKKP